LRPGEVLLEEFLKPMGLSQNRLPLDIGVPARRIYDLDIAEDILGDRLKREVQVSAVVREGLVPYGKSSWKAPR
jgi:hypothetical protein